MYIFKTANFKLQYVYFNILNSKYVYFFVEKLKELYTHVIQIGDESMTEINDFDFTEYVTYEEAKKCVDDLPSYYCKWTTDSIDSESEEEEEEEESIASDLTELAETLLLNDNQKAKLLDNYLKRNFFREIIKVSNTMNNFVMR